MSAIDILLGAVLAFAFYKGWKNGLFVELASLVSYFVGIYIAIKFSYLIQGSIGSIFGWSEKTAKVVAFVLTLLLVIVGIHFLAKVFTKMASFAFLGWLNTLGGAVFATLKATLLLGIVLSIVLKININDLLISKEKQNESVFFNPVLKTSEAMLPFLKDWFEDLKGKVK
jgi:membrane protein required for colicin V production